MMAGSWIPAPGALYEGNFAGLARSSRDIFTQLRLMARVHEHALELPRGCDVDVGLMRLVDCTRREAKLALEELAHPELPLVAFEGDGVLRYLVIVDPERWETTRREGETVDAQVARRRTADAERQRRRRERLRAESVTAPVTPADRDVTPPVTRDSQRDCHGMDLSRSEREEKEYREKNPPPTPVTSRVTGTVTGGVTAPVTEEGGVEDPPREPEPRRSEPVSEVRLKAAPPLPTDADVFEETMKVVLGNPGWTFNRRLPSNLEALRAVMGWFDAADLKELPDRRQAMGRVLVAFTMWLGRPEQSRRTLDPPHLRDFLDTHEEQRPRKLRASAPKSPAKVQPAPDLVAREDVLSFCQNFGRGMPA
jgi:hypothetical protein